MQGNILIVLKRADIKYPIDQYKKDVQTSNVNSKHIIFIRGLFRYFLTTIGGFMFYCHSQFSG